jgi:hypothetical protein
MEFAALNVEENPTAGTEKTEDARRKFFFAASLFMLAG